MVEEEVGSLAINIIFNTLFVLSYFTIWLVWQGPWKENKLHNLFAIYCSGAAQDNKTSCAPPSCQSKRATEGENVLKAVIITEYSASCPAAVAAARHAMDLSRHVRRRRPRRRHRR